jgi:integrase
MAVVKLTKTLIDSLAFATVSGKHIYYYDTELKGFGLRITTQAKTYFVEGKIANRKTVRVSLGKHGILTTEEARKQAKTKLAELANGANPNALKKEDNLRLITLQQVYDDYLAGRDLKPKTVQEYNNCLRLYLSDWLNTPVIRITRDQVEAKHREISTRGAAAANLTMRLLRSLLNFAAEYRDAQGLSIIPDNPVRRLSAKKIWNRIERRQNVIKPHELKAWFQAVQQLENTTLRDYLMLVLFTGLRREEAAQLEWSRVDLQARTLTVLDTKNRLPHVLPLSDFLFDLFNARKAEQSSTYVFAGNGAGGYIVEPRKQMAKVTEQTGITFTVHDLRRTFITIAEGLDIPAYALKRLLNHKISHDVTGGYVIADAERLREPMQKVTDFILKTANATQL